MSFTTLSPAVPHIKDGKLRALAVTSRTRSQTVPDVPTMTEAGYPDIEGDTWVGVLAPAGTDPQIITLLNREIVKIMRTACHEGTLGAAWLRAGRHYARRICCPDQDRNREMGKGHSLSGHPDAVKPIVKVSLPQSMAAAGLRKATGHLKSIIISQLTCSARRRYNGRPSLGRALRPRAG